MTLSDMTVRHARITGNDYTLGYTDGLALNVTAQGGKIWRFRCYWAGTQKRMSLGSYPQIGLKEARARRDEARALVAQGINPYEYRKQQRRADRTAAEHTFEAVFNQWVEFRRLSLQTLVPQLYEPSASIDYRPLANLLVPLPWHRGRVVMIGDAVHTTTPRLASGAGIGIESAIVLAEELLAHNDLQVALSRFEMRRWERWERCELVGLNSARLCEIEKSGVGREEHAHIMRASTAMLAEPI